MAFFNFENKLQLKENYENQKQELNFIKREIIE